MRRLKNIFGLALVALAGLTATSCTDGNDWSVDKAYDRLFGINDDDISIETTATTATVTFTAMEKSAEYYIIEVSKDSLYDDVPMGGENAKVFGAENHDITKSPVVLEGLDGDTKYYLRIKAMSSTKPESSWSYYDEGEPFKTEAEQIFNEVPAEDIGDSSVRLTWTPGAEVTRLAKVYTAAGDVTDTAYVDLDDEAKAAGEYTFSDLNPTTVYTFIIYNGDVKRGTVSVTTAAAMPGADYKVQLPEGTTVLTQEMINGYAAEAQAEAGTQNASVTIGIPAGTVLDLQGENDASTGEEKAFYIPEGASVTFFGMAGAKPSISLRKALEIGGSHSYVRFDNVDLIDNGCQYVINQSKACALEELSFSGVNINGLGRSLFRLQGSTAKTVRNVKVDNCVITNHQDYQLFYFNNAAYTVESLTISNSTFNGSAHSFIDPSNCSSLKTITISDCTFYNIIGGSGKYLINASGLSVEVNLTNCIFAKTASTSSKGIRTAGSLTVTNCLMTSDFKLTSNAFKADIDDSPSSEDLFTDPANGDFTLKIARYVNTIGDPRWYTE